jgi:hypothetical protein
MVAHRQKLGDAGSQHLNLGCDLERRGFVRARGVSAKKPSG